MSTRHLSRSARISSCVKHKESAFSMSKSMQIIRKPSSRTHCIFSKEKQNQNTQTLTTSVGKRWTSAESNTHQQGAGVVLGLCWASRLNERPCDNVGVRVHLHQGYTHDHFRQVKTDPLLKRSYNEMGTREIVGIRTSRVSKEARCCCCSAQTHGDEPYNATHLEARSTTIRNQCRAWSSYNGKNTCKHNVG